MAIFNDWLPGSGHVPADAPVFERYDERFDARTGMGGFEIWVPIKTQHLNVAPILVRPNRAAPEVENVVV